MEIKELNQEEKEKLFREYVELSLKKKEISDQLKLMKIKVIENITSDFTCNAGTIKIVNKTKIEIPYENMDLEVKIPEKIISKENADIYFKPKLELSKLTKKELKKEGVLPQSISNLVMLDSEKSIKVELN